MLVLTLCVVWFCCQGTVATNERFVTFTHPETCFPASSGIISEAPIVRTFVNQTIRVSDDLTRRQKRLKCYEGINLVFRTADGSCNNRLNRGESFQLLGRILPPAYSDGIQSPRQYSVLGGPLPSARTVSRAVHPDKKTVTDLTIYVMQWGQFIDHDLVSTLLPIEDTRGTVQCCGPDAGPPPNPPVERECFPIVFPPGDPDFRGSCMEFIRSQPARERPRENENAVTSFLDASTVYGSTQEELDRLRDTKTRYLLKTTDDNFPTNNGLDDCIKPKESDICFLAGDARVNELPGLTLMHTVFLRYHNYVARELVAHNPYVWHEKVFHQTRAIVTAVVQNIVLKEWLPIVLGPRIRRRFRLDLHPYRRTRHRPRTDPTIFQAFSTAAFRFGHTLIPRSLPLTPTRRVPLRELFFMPSEARENLDTLAQGLARAIDDEDRSQDADRFLVSEVTSHLFENQEGPRRAFDLAALNIHRSRDHGLPGYNAYRQRVGLPKVTSFNDSALGTSGPALASVYADVDDIDLFSGGMSEPAFDGGLVGETFSRLIGLQMSRLKFGDRFFFDNRPYPFGFSDYQVLQLKRARFSHLLCLTTGITKVQRDVYRVVSRSNPEVSCERLKQEHIKLGFFRRFPI